MIAFRPEASLIYVNADTILESVLDRVRAVDTSDLRLVICDLSASPYVDLGGARMLHELHSELAAAVPHCASSGRTDGCEICCEPKA